MTPTINVMMVEDHPDYREGISLALETVPDINLIGSYSTAERALQVLQNARVGQTPEVLLLDLNLPGISGLESIRWIKEYAPKTRIIVLTQSDQEEDVMKAISLGVAGYLLKSATLNKITNGIRTVAKGGASLDSKMAKYILETLRKLPPKREIENLLTKREIEVLTLLSEGLLKKQISNELGISNATVSTHVSHIYDKLDVKNAPSAISAAFQAGILPTEE